MSGPWVVTIFGAPVTKKNHSAIVRAGRRGRPFLIPSAPYRHWQATARVERGAGWKTDQPLTAELNCRALFFRERRHGDLVGYLQALGDLLQHRGLIANDRQLVSFDGSRLRHDKANSRIELVLELVRVEACA